MARKHTTLYSPLEYDQLNRYNQLVEVWLWIGILVILGSVAFLNALTHLHGRRRRSKAATYAITRQRPPKGCARTGKRCSRWVPATLVAFWRKYTGHKSDVAGYLYIDGPLAQVILILSYVLLNLLLVFLGGALVIEISIRNSLR